MIEQNATIEDTMLGIEDHGIMTFFLFLKYPSGGQGFGGFALDGKSGKIGHAKSILAIRRVLETLDVLKWEQLKGKYCRVRKEHDFGDILEIGHIVEDKWFSLKEHFGDSKDN